MDATTPFLILSAETSDLLRKRIAELRDAAGLTQLQLAERLGISPGRYNHYERGIRRLPIELLPKVAAALAVTESELFGVTAPRAKRGPASGWEKRVEAIKTLPTDKQREIQNVVDALLASQGKSAA
jgi:transcriptional regulator with XRE-family HTH domain